MHSSLGGCRPVFVSDSHACDKVGNYRSSCVPEAHAESTLRHADHGAGRGLRGTVRTEAASFPLVYRNKTEKTEASSQANLARTPAKEPCPQQLRTERVPFRLSFQFTYGQRALASLTVAEWKVMAEKRVRQGGGPSGCLVLDFHLPSPV